MTGQTRLLTIWNRLRSTYWFVPSLMTAGAVGLAALLVAVDRRAPEGSPFFGWAYSGGADGARALLSAVASSTITVVSLTFSVTVVALTVSSQHFGPRLLSNFMRDSAAQFVLGMFIGTFAYCLIVLRTVQGEGDSYDRFVPHVAVTAAVGLALVSVGALIYYLHHVAASMQVSEISLNVTRDLETAIDRLYPEDAGREPEPPPPAVPEPPADGVAVAARSSGYVQTIDLDSAFALAEKHRTPVWLRANPGDFVSEGACLAVVPSGLPEAEAFADALRDSYVIGSDRTPWQDAEFAIQQLVEIGLHALSPGINEPFTAITCIDRLGQALSRLVIRRMPAAVRINDEQQIRLVAEPRSFPSLLAAAFDPIAIHAGTNPAIYRRLLETLEHLGQIACRPADRAAIREHARSIRDRALREIQDDRPRRLVEALHLRVLAAVSSRDAGDRGRATV